MSFAVVTLLTGFAFVVHGYHPYSEDGGVYVAGIKWLLNPSLYPHGTAFVTEHLRFSLFAPAVADAARWSHLSVAWTLSIGYVGSLWLTLYGAWMVVSRCVSSHAGRCGGVALLACGLTLPIAGTSLMLVDPYLTARSFSTAAVPFCLAGVLDILARRRAAQGWLLAFCSLLVAVTVHPLMAGYGLASALLLASVGSRRFRLRGTIGMCVAAVIGAGLLQLAGAAETPDYVRVAMTRYYWFPARWEWYELLGLVGPAIVLAALLRRPRNGAWKSVATMALALAAVSAAVAVLYSRAGLTSHLVARMQPLRCFQIVYLAMTLLLGAWLGERVLKGKAWRWAAMLLGLGGLMYGVQESVYPASPHLEMPWTRPRNAWVRAFDWVRENTPADALFALDAHYITTDGEDAQCFRAIAERSALADYSKDGGEAAITPELTPAWVAGQAAQTGLSAETDAARVAALKPLGVTWAVLKHGANTDFDCPYRNEAVKVCRLP